MSILSPDSGPLISEQESSRTPRKRKPLWLLPAALLLGFLLIFLLLFRNRLIPAAEVDVSSAIGIEEAVENAPLADARHVTGEMLFQASGWVEPDPFPIKATALTNGIVEEVHVYEGELVKKGDLLASLISIDTRLKRDAMVAKLEDIKASFEAHCVGTQLALQRMEVEKAQLAIAEADAEETADKFRRYENLSEGSITQDQMLEVRLDRKRTAAEVEAAKARIKGIAEELNQIAYQVQAIQARIRNAEIDLETAELAHSRTRIHAPVDGRVLILKAAPGQKKMIDMDMEDSATIAILYEPQHLQVRVDVPLADAAGLSVGQGAKIRSNLLPDQVFEGEVTRIEGAADIQRNTLQAKVRIENPSPKLRPEMLCRVEFFETVRTGEVNTGSEQTGIAVYVTKSAVEDGSVWICDPETRRAEKRRVEVSGRKGGMLRISGGVRPGEWVISNPSGLKEGQRINPNMKDRT